jgi:hypothetical protein
MVLLPIVECTIVELDMHKFESTFEALAATDNKLSNPLERNSLQCLLGE